MADDDDDDTGLCESNCALCLWKLLGITEDALLQLKNKVETKQMKNVVKRTSEIDLKQRILIELLKIAMQL